MIIRVELFQGRAYALDEAGNIWRLRADTGEQPQLECIRRVNGHNTHELAKPTLARFDPDFH